MSDLMIKSTTNYSEDLIKIDCDGYLLFGYVTHGGSKSDQKTRGRLKKILSANMFISEFRGMYVTPIFRKSSVDNKKSALKEIENVKEIEMWFAYLNKRDFVDFFEIFKKVGV